MTFRRFILGTLSLLSLSLVAVSVGQQVWAAGVYDPSAVVIPAGQTAEHAGYNPEVNWLLSVTVGSGVGYAIAIATSFFGILFLLIIIYAGFLWMTASGNEEQIGKAKAWLKNGIIGLVIIFAAYTISSLVLYGLGRSAGYQTGIENSGQTTDPLYEQ